MTDMTTLDWKHLMAIADGKSATAASKACHKKLTERQYIMPRHNGSLAITGLGRESLLRRKYKLPIPPNESDTPEQPRPAAEATEAEDLAA
ncbi:MAG: hypothetical protein JWR07_3981 [Nevskia sp.]|nr:hypothetical protein [Nevskia sp.]